MFFDNHSVGLDDSDVICNLMYEVLILDVIPLSSDRQHLSYGVCLEVRGEIIRTVLCCIVYDSCAQS